MTDLIERLRAHAALHRGLGFDDDDEQAQWARDLLTAAEEIERLRTRLEIDQRHPIDGIEARDATIREQDKEIERLRAALRWEQHRAERQGTHGDGCADWGPAHYECAIRERDELRRQLAEAEQDARRYRWIAGHCRSTSEHWGGRWSIVVEGPCPAKHDEEDAFDDAIDAAMDLTRPAEES